MAEFGGLKAWWKMVRNPHLERWRLYEVILDRSVQFGFDLIFGTCSLELNGSMKQVALWQGGTGFAF